MIDALLGVTYSLVGFVMGFMLGRITREVHEIKEAVVPESFAEENAATHRMRLTRLGVVVVILSVVTVISSAASTIAVYHQSDCLRDYNSRFTVAFNARAQANDADRRALNTMILSIADNSKDQTARKMAFANYVQTIKDSDRTRARNPLPQPPDPQRLCGDN